MSFGFECVDRDQQFLLPPDMRSWLPADHEVWFVIDVVESLDLSGLEGSYRLGGVGRAPVAPSMLLTLLVWAYSRGLRSSRRIERACHEDVSFRVICGGRVPDHTTVARFRQRHVAVAAELFDQVLEVCVRAGLTRLGVVALDGTKMSANAAKKTTRSLGHFRGLVDGWFQEAAGVDAVEDDEFGVGCSGLGVPEDLVKAGARRERLRALIDEIDVEGRPRRWVNETDPDSRVMSCADGGTVQGFNAQIVVGEDLVVVAALVTSDENDTQQLIPMVDEMDRCLAAAGVDATPGVLLADSGYFTEHNVAVMGERGQDVLIPPGKNPVQRRVPVAADSGAAHAVLQDLVAAHRDRVDVYEKEKQVRRAAELAVRDRRIAVFETLDREGGDITDFLGELQLGLKKATTMFAAWQRHGNTVVPAPRFRRDPSVPKPVSNATFARQHMAMRLADPLNRDRYKRRSHMVETVFGHMKHNMGIDRFSRRGLAAVNAEWQLIMMVHNIGRLATKNR